MSALWLSQSGEGARILRRDRRDFLKHAGRVLGTAMAVTLGNAQTRTSVGTPAHMFEGFKTAKVRTTGATINVVSGGQGPPVLLLHGSPQSHVMWHKIAPVLSREFTVLAADLRGYGDSSKPPDGENHSNYSKRAMALDQIEVMSHFGFQKFAVVGHDRGGRVGHRLALDYPDRVQKLAVIDMVPTYKMLHSVNNQLATAFYHWFLMVQPAPLPETLIANNAEFYLKYMMFREAWHGPIPTWMGQVAFSEYLRCYRDPATIHANCEDYRAAASIDMKHDQADLGRKITCPVLSLWGEQGAVGRLFDVLAVWRERAENVSGKPLSGRHFLPEESPEQTSAELQAFLSS
jgi:haloacetate dehalogenase